MREFEIEFEGVAVEQQEYILNEQLTVTCKIIDNVSGYEIDLISLGEFAAENAHRIQEEFCQDQFERNMTAPDVNISFYDMADNGPSVTLSYNSQLGEVELYYLNEYLDEEVEHTFVMTPEQFGNLLLEAGR